MPKNLKKAKNNADQGRDGEKNSEVKNAKSNTAQRRERPMLRAIRVTAELLAAAKEYKKATGKSFYALGLEAITERLEKEGFLKGSTGQ